MENEDILELVNEEDFEDFKFEGEDALTLDEGEDFLIDPVMALPKSRKRKRGLFITFEGLDGSGKSTQVAHLRRYFEKNHIRMILTHEPGGTKLGNKIRSLLLNPSNTEIASKTEVLLYAAARAQHVEQIIEPALEAGMTVVCDRFIDSSMAYQGYGRGLLEETIAVNKDIIKEVIPDITFYLRMDPHEVYQRIASRKPDRMEEQGLEFYKKVAEGYENEAKLHKDRICIIDAKLTENQIKEKIRFKVQKLMKSRGFYGIE